MAAMVAGISALLSNVSLPEGVSPLVVTMPSPPPLEGALKPNSFLTKVFRYAEHNVHGPESLVVVPDQRYRNQYYVFTGTRNGRIVKIMPNGRVQRILRMSIRSCGQRGATEDACGRPLGLRAHRGGLIVADAYNGIFTVNPFNRYFRQLVDARNQRVNGRPLGYINDLAVTSDGTIFFSSSSSKWKPSQLLNIIFEGETSGRILVYNPREILASRRVQELVTQLHYPNGLQLSPDQTYLLIGEGGRSRIWRAWIGRRTPKFGTIELFADNLPGFVDNIRLSPRGTYWVGLSRARHADLPSVLDIYGKDPETRAKLIGLVNRKVIFDDPAFGIVVELDDQGEIIRSLQDPDGTSYTSVSEVAEINDLLFIASKAKDYVGVINLRSLPRPSPLDSIIGPDSGKHVVDISKVSDKGLKELLTSLRDRLARTAALQIRSLVLILVKRLFEAREVAQRAQDQMTRLRSDMDNLQALVSQSMTSGGGGNRPGPNTNPETSSAAETTTSIPVTSDTTVTVTTEESSTMPVVADITTIAAFADITTIATLADGATVKQDPGLIMGPDDLSQSGSPDIGAGGSGLVGDSSSTLGPSNDAASQGDTSSVPSPRTTGAISSSPSSGNMT